MSGQVVTMIEQPPGRYDRDTCILQMASFKLLCENKTVEWKLDGLSKFQFDNYQVTA